MKHFAKWRDMFIVFATIISVIAVYALLQRRWMDALIFILVLGGVSWLFLGLWRSVKKQGVETGVEISKILGRDAKDALTFGRIGIITYNDEYVATWVSGYFRELGLDLLNCKLCAWMPDLKPLMDGNVDVLQGSADGQVFEVSKRHGAQVLYFRNITEIVKLRTQLCNEGVVVGLLTLDNYQEYQSYENEEILSEINTHLRTPLITWARNEKIFIRRVRSDRFLILMDTEILNRLRKDNFSILQKVKDIATHMDISITLSMVLVYGTSDFAALDTMLNELLELVLSRGGDQVAIRNAAGKIEFIGGNSEKSTVRSKVRVSIMTNTIQDLIKDSRKVFILGHQNSDYDCMGAALAMENWCRALGREAFVVLRDVSRDRQLQETMDHYHSAIFERHTFITEEDALRLADPDEDLVIMVDHGVPAISSGRRLIEKCKRVLVIDHHRRGEGFVNSPTLTYVESKASSTCELVTELLETTAVPVPIFEAEATIMYLGILVDTNRFKTHTSQRTFQAAGTLRLWGASAQVAEKALQEDLAHFRERAELISQARPYLGRFMIAALKEPVDRTMMSQVSDALLQIKGCQASFTIARNSANGKVAISARSDGSFNVQKVMEKLSGGGHFTAAAAEFTDLNVEEAQKALKEILDQEEEKS